MKSQILSAVVLLSAVMLPPARNAPRVSGQGQQEPRGSFAEPTDAPQVRAQIAEVEKLLPHLADRGAGLYFLAVSKEHLGESIDALKLLKECIDLEEGFEPSDEPTFAGLKGTHDFDEMVEHAQKSFPVVNQAHVVMVTHAKDLIPEGLAYDAKGKTFLLGSIHLKKIVGITEDSHTADFVPQGRYGLLPILGLRMDPKDGTVWAASTAERQGRTELLHFDGQGKLLGRYSPKDGKKHGFNDLVVLKSGDVIATDSLSDQVFRFGRVTQKFASLAFDRPLFFPNGIALADDDRALYVADSLGVIRYNLANGTSQDVRPGEHSTLAGIDGLYGYRGGLVAVQNGIGTPRIAAFRLSDDGSSVTHTEVLENRTPLTELPTTGAIRGPDFFFICNSQLDNLNGDNVLDITRLAPVRIAMVRLP